ncbi:uncharacterized protein LOC134282959 isoform X2 [Saccostrea cucullata]|uniref:uncharacterized protein LOC134267262 isoform X2 n=1 Tax=Saccostrea cuccullata TaxID=36930 RepID=UPI002ED5C0D6
MMDRKTVLCLLCYFSFMIAGSVRWPVGSYTLVKPDTGCPEGWYDGWREQDTEDVSNQNRWTRRNHFYGRYFSDSSLRFYYCTKTPYNYYGRGHWPKGDYCILRQTYYCPKGFREGTVRWDDEDYVNGNDYKEYVPAGTFDDDTEIEYCCRNDGYYGTAIELPTERPFYLLRFRGYCQLVKGMYVIEEYVYSDDEDFNNKNRVSGAYPSDAGGSDHKLYYCYYYKKYY